MVPFSGLSSFHLLTSMPPSFHPHLTHNASLSQNTIRFASYFPQTNPCKSPMSPSLLNPPCGLAHFGARSLASGFATLGRCSLSVTASRVFCERGCINEGVFCLKHREGSSRAIQGRSMSADSRTILVSEQSCALLLSSAVGFNPRRKDQDCFIRQRAPGSQ